MKIKVVLTLLLLCVSTLTFAQNKAIIKANEAYARENFCDAAELCKTAYAKITRKGSGAQKKKADMAFKAAECYRHTERYRDANEWYDRAILLEHYEDQPLVYLYNADMLLKMREFDKAKENYEKYKNLVPGDARANAGIESCTNNKIYIAEKKPYVIENQTAINKPEFDMAPMFGDRKATKLYFGSSRVGATGKETNPRSCEPYMDIWVSELDKKENWTEPYKVVGEGINTEDDEGTVCFDSRSKLMFFTRCPNVKKQNLGCDIWMSEAKGKKEWKEPKKLSLKSHDSISVGHPCTEDGKYLIFASDMPGGYGGRDLWYTTFDRKTDSWAAPKNMGPEINTKGNELFPTFANNGDLFFSTDGRPGLGGLDIYRATKVGEDNKWENPENVGSPINGENNDYAMIEASEDGRFGYFTSERKGPNGENIPDIYSYEQPPYIYSLKVTAQDLGENDAPIEGAIITVSGPDGNWTGITEEDGSIFWDKKPAGDRYINESSDYTLKISKDGYYEDTVGMQLTTIDVNYDQDFIMNMGLFPKRPIRLPEVRYVLNQWTFINDSTCMSLDSLDRVYQTLMDHPNLVLELSSHTDSRGRNDRNKTLSENRARACYQYLVETKGIDPRRLVPVGKGEESPREVFLKDGVYHASRNSGGESTMLVESYINGFRRSNKELFSALHTMNRRTEGAVLSLGFDPATAPPADPKYMEYLPY
ncbi:MAG: OmpA family protein [Crocinitomicaceae bacterium]|nr:OmpA family protein [Crocinitomicaceae bacterium]